MLYETKVIYITGRKMNRSRHVTTINLKLLG